MALKSRKITFWMLLWSLCVVVFGGVPCCFQKRLCLRELIFVPSGNVRSVLGAMAVPRSSPAYAVGLVYFFLCPPKVGVYVGGKFSDVLLRCMQGRQKLFPVQIFPGRSDVETIAQIRSLPYIDASGGWGAPYEGFYPDTYYVAWGTPLERVLRDAQERLNKFAHSVWRERGRAVRHLSPGQLVILASIVEKETHILEEYQLVATVYLHRLGKKMRGRLCACPTVQYALDKLPNEHKRRKKRRILFKDLYTVDAYNTYRRSGLPPGPIANPSPQVLKAIARMDNLREGVFYFLWCAPEQRHVFSSSLKEHFLKKKRCCGRKGCAK